MVCLVTLLICDRRKMAGPSNARESNVFNEDRLASIVRSVYTALQTDFRAAAQTSSPHASVEEEIRSRFETPRGATSGSSLHPYPPSSSSANSQARYNPRVNYGKEKGKGKGKSKIGSTKKQILATKELILLPSPKYNKVPWFERKRRLQERGLIIDGFPFDKSWDETQLQVKVINPYNSLICCYCLQEIFGIRFFTNKLISMILFS